MVEFVPSVTFPAPGLVLRQGVPYIVYEPVLQKWSRAGLKGNGKPFKLENRWRQQPVKSLLMIGGGGMGDRIQMTPAMRTMSRQAGCVVDVCHCGSADEWLGLPYGGNVSLGTPTRRMVESYEGVVELCGVVSETDATEVPLDILFARRFGVELDDRFPDYWIQPGEERMVSLPEKQRPLRVGLHFGQQAPARVWPAHYLLELAVRLVEDHADLEVLLLGQAQEAASWQANIGGQYYTVPPPSDKIFDYCGHTPSVRALAVAMKTCDVWVDVDSGPLHLAGALNIPSVGLYGPFPWAIRGANLPSIEPLQAHPDPKREECSCYTHAQRGEPLPCKQQHCSLMEAIKPELVVEAVRKVVQEHYGRQAQAGAPGRRRRGGQPR